MKRQKGIFFFMAIGFLLGIVIAEKKSKKGIINGLLTTNKNYVLFRLMNQWVKVKQEGKNLSEYFRQCGYKKIAIYGMGYIGDTLLNELKGTETEVLYGIDRNASSTYANIDVVSLSDEFKPVDAIVLTVIDSFEMISERVQEKINCPILSIIDVVFDA